MKKIVSSTLIVLAAIGVLLLMGNIEHNYTRKYCSVYKVENGNIVTFEDISGNLWEYEGYGYKKGEEVFLKMNDNNTPYIEDDIITKVIRK